MLPRLSRWLLQAFVPPERLEDVEGDLFELHARRVERLGRRLGRVLTLADALRVAGGFALHRARESWSDLRTPVTWPELRHGLRLVGRQPILNLVAVATLVIGLALVNVGLAVMDSALFSVLPFENGERFVRIAALEARTGAWTALDRERFEQLAAEATSLEYLGAQQPEELNVSFAPDQPEQIRAVRLSPDAFEHLPAKPLLGRTLLRGDGDAGATPVALIRESVWRRRFGASPEAIGARLDVSGAARTIVGVLPDDFEFPNSPLLWLPIGRHTAGGAVGEVFGILAPGTSIETAREQIGVLSANHEAIDPGAPEPPPAGSGRRRGGLAGGTGRLG